MATKKPASHRLDYSKDDIRQLKALIKAKSSMIEIGKALRRTPAGVRMKAYTMGILPTRKRKIAGRADR